MNRYRSITYPQSGFSIMRNGHLILSKIGTVRMFMHRKIYGEIKTLTTSRDNVGDWFASFTVQEDIVRVHVENPDMKKQGEVGGDAGLTHLLTMSDGTFVDTPHFLRKAERSLKREQRTLSRKEKGSNNMKKQKNRVAIKHRKVKRQREDFAHKVSSNLVNNNSFIAFEDLNIRNMVKNHHLAKSISDASWGMLVQYTTYKAESAGKVVVLVDPRNTSKTCSRCGWIRENMNLSDRIFHCDICGLTMDRDLNAAINTYKRGMIEIGRAPPEYTPVEIGAIPARATPVGEAGSPIQKSVEDVTLQYILLH